MFKLIFIVTVAWSILTGANALAQGGLDDVLQGFEEPKAAAPAPAGDGVDQVLEGFTDTPSPAGKADKAGPGRNEPFVLWGRPLEADLSGSISLSGALNISHGAPEPGATDQQGLSKLRPEMDAELDLSWGSDWKARLAGRAFYDLVYDMKPSADYPDARRRAYQEELELGEAWLQGELTSDLDIKIGRQIVVWGKSDNIRVTDILNPLDNREPGLTDIEDLRLPVFMVKVDYYFGPWCLSGISIPEIRFNKDPVPGSDFYPLDRATPPEDHPDSFTLADTEWALSLSGVFSGWDLALYWARVYNDPAYMAALGPEAVERRHARITMAGASANLALGNWLLKSEAALLDGLRFFADPDRDYCRLDVLAGVEYTGFTDTTLSLELADRHLFDFTEGLEADPDDAREDDLQWILRFTRKFWHETLEVTLLASTFGLGGGHGSFQRIQADYDITDRLSATGGLVLYQSGDRINFRNVGDNDRLFFTLQYSF
jgi:hypothetical protein